MKKSIKSILDLIMMVLMLIAMCYQITGNLWHEIIGVGLFICFIAHCVLNGKWFKNMRKIVKKASKEPRQFIMLVSNLLLMLVMLVLAVTSIMISKSIFGFLGIGSGGVVKSLHVAASYGGLLLISIHLGCHWKSILWHIKKAFGITQMNRSVAMTSRGIAIIFAVWGIINSFRLGVGGKIFMLSGERNGKGAHGESDYNRENWDHHRGNGRGFDSTTLSTLSTDSNEGSSLDNQYCDGCGRHCPLSSPGCGVGYQKAQEYQDSTNDSEQDTQDKQSIPETDSTQTVPKISVEGDAGLAAIFTDYIPIMGLYIGGTYYALEIIEKKRKKKIQKTE